MSREYQLRCSRTQRSSRRTARPTCARTGAISTRRRRSRSSRRRAAAQAAGLKPEQVNVHTTFLGGGFGRRLEVDFIPAAVEASKAVGKPVKLLWTREDDTTHDTYRPPALRHGNRRAGQGWARSRRSSCTSSARPSPHACFPRWSRRTSIRSPSRRPRTIPYDVPNVQVDYLQHEIGINVGLHALGEPRAQLLRGRELHRRAGRRMRRKTRWSSASRCSKSSRAIAKCCAWPRAKARLRLPAERPFPRRGAHGRLRHVHGAGGRDLHGARTAR